MPARYSSEYKSLVTRLLFMYGGNIPLVSHLTGIPQRTLRDWRGDPFLPPTFTAAIRREDDPERREQGELPPQNNSSTAVADNLVVLKERLMQQALNLVGSVSEDASESPLPQRALALTRLIDRIVKLDSYLPSDDSDDVKIVYHDYLSSRWRNDDMDDDDWDESPSESPPDPPTE